MSFTPGPWEPHPDGPYIIWNPRTGQRIAHVHDVRTAEGLRDVEAEREHTHLIAAAPDLYDVCQRLVTSAEYWGDYDVPIGIVDRLRAALAKARGDQR